MIIVRIHGFAVSFLLGLILSGNALAITNLKLNAPLVEGGDVFDFQISSDDNWVVYRADQETDNFFEVYSVPIQGNVPPVKLTTGNNTISSHRIILDGKRVVYHNFREIFTVCLLMEDHHRLSWYRKTVVLRVLVSVRMTNG